MMEDVIYGVIFNANTDMFAKEPPVTASKKPKESPACSENQVEKNSPSTPGSGSSGTYSDDNKHQKGKE